MGKAIAISNLPVLLSALRRQGFLQEFVIEGDYLRCPLGTVHVNDFVIQDTIRCEEEQSNSAPRLVCLIECYSGNKGLLITSCAPDQESISEAMLEKLWIG